MIPIITIIFVCLIIIFLGFCFSSINNEIKRVLTIIILLINLLLLLTLFLPTSLYYLLFSIGIIFTLSILLSFDRHSLFITLLVVSMLIPIFYIIDFRSLSEFFAILSFLLLGFIIVKEAFYAFIKG